MKVNQVKCWFLRRGETGVPRENLSSSVTGLYRDFIETSHSPWLLIQVGAVSKCYHMELRNADWLRRREFFLHEGIFGNQEGMIT